MDRWNSRRRRVWCLKFALERKNSRKLREARDFAELSKVAKVVGCAPSDLLRAGWTRSDK
jgi:hypothetical protein